MLRRVVTEKTEEFSSTAADETISQLHGFTLDLVYISS
jgi:hypothetical protein